MQKAELTYEVVITCTNLAGIQSLVGHNLAMSVLTLSLVTPALQVLWAKTGLPPLPTDDTGVFRQDDEDENSLVEPFVVFLGDQFGVLPWKWPRLELSAILFPRRYKKA